MTSNTPKETIALLDLLEKEGYVCEKALFLSYSLSAKTQFLALLRLFGIKADAELSATENNSKKKNKTASVSLKVIMKERLKKLLQYPNKEKSSEENYAEQLKKVAFVCNNGSDEGSDSLIGMYTSEFTYSYMTEKSFHPKLYVVKFKEKNGTKTVYRMIVGSMNFTNAPTLELLVHFDLEETEQSENAVCGLAAVNELLDITEKEGMLTGAEHICNRKERLLSFVEELGLHKAYFKKEDLEKVNLYTFPMLETNETFKKLRNSDCIFSPFLSKEKLNTKAKIYTMAAELEKQGYSEVVRELAEKDSPTEKGQEFFVYFPQTEEQPVFNHIKLYESEKQVYIGSLNFTNSAWQGNKELVVRLQKDAQMNAFLEQMKKNYICRIYKKPEKDSSKSAEKTISDSFRSYIKNVVQNSVLIRTEEPGVGVKVRLEINKLSEIEMPKELKNKDFKIVVAYSKFAEVSLQGEQERSWLLKDPRFHSEKVKFMLKKNSIIQSECEMAIRSSGDMSEQERQKQYQSDKVQAVLSSLEQIAEKISAGLKDFTHSVTDSTFSGSTLPSMRLTGKLPVLEDALAKTLREEPSDYKELLGDIKKHAKRLEAAANLSKRYQDLGKADKKLADMFMEQVEELEKNYGL